MQIKLWTSASQLREAVSGTCVLVECWSERLNDSMVEICVELPEPHCDAHERFEPECLECADALERQR